MLWCPWNLCSVTKVVHWGEWNAKFLWVTVPSVSGALIRNLSLVIGESMVWGTLDQMTQANLASWEASTSPRMAGVTLVLWKTLKVENKEKHVRLRLARSCLHLFEEHRQCIPAGLIAGCVTFGTLFYLILFKSVKIQRYQHFREISRSGTSVLHVRNLPSDAILYKNTTTALTLFQRSLKLFGFGWFLFRG